MDEREGTSLDSTCLCNPSTTTISDLPDEILLQIFSYCTLEDLSCRLIFVCQRWKTLVDDPILWRNSKLVVDEDQSMSFIIHILASSPRLESLCVEYRDANDFLMLASDLCQNIRKLSLKLCEPIRTSTWLQIVERWPDIRELNVEGTELVQSYDLVAGFQNLSHLNLSHCKNINGPILRKIASKCKCLVDLNIDGIYHIGDADVEYIIDERKDTLVSLILDGENLTDKSISKVGECQKLRTLEISFCDEMTDECLRGVGSLQLFCLKLRRGMRFSSDALAIMLGQKGMSGLISLDLSECSNLNDHGVAVLSKNCSLLQFLALQWCWVITEGGVECIIKSCSKLTVLNLLGLHRITGASFQHIPTHLKLLQFLDVQQCNHVKDEGLIDIVKKVPTLSVKDYYGQIVSLPS